MTFARVPWVSCALTESSKRIPDSARGSSAFAKTRSAASNRSCGLKTFPIPVSGIVSIAITPTGTAARSGVRSRTKPPARRVYACSRLELDISDRQFARVGVGLANDCSKRDGRMLKQHVLEPRRINVVTPTNDEILGATGDPEISVFI